MSVAMKRSAFCSHLLSWAALGLQAASPPVALTGSFGASVGFDDNLYLQDGGPLAAGQTMASVSAREFSGVVMGKFSLMGKGAAASWVWSASYAPELFQYLDHKAENHTDHRWSLLASRAAGEWKTALKLGGVEIDGSREGLVYNRLGGGPPIGGVPVRARRAQGQYKGGVLVSHTRGNNFLRAVANAAATDFRTTQRKQTGYSNYVDRSEWDSGLDYGRKAGPAFWIFSGVRVGEQRQENLLGVALNSSSTFVRGLVGLEGKLGEHWTLTVTLGEDRRVMDEDRLAGSERVRAEPYADVSVARTLGAKDALTFSFKQGVILAGSGKSAYVDTLGDLGWKHQWAAAWDTTLGATFDFADFKDMVTAPKREWIATLSASTGWAVTKALRLEAGVVRDVSESLIENTPGREYRRWQGRMGCNWAW